MSTKKEELIAQYQAEYALYKRFAKYISPKYISIDCNFGWLPVLEEFFQCCEDNNYPIQVSQIKEKFGDLRVYYRAERPDTDMFNKLDDIINKTCTMCDICGAPGKKGGKGWIATRCESHANMNSWADVSYDEVLSVVDGPRQELHKLIGRK